MKKERLFAPGPTPVPDDVALAMAAPIVHHRSPAFAPTIAAVAEGLKWLFQSEEPVITFAASGTGAMEAAVANFTARGDTVIVVRGGKFGERWGEISAVYGLEVVPIDVEWGTAVTPDRVAEALRAHPEARAVMVQASETSTGAAHPVRALAELTARRPETLLFVDAISAMGCMELKTHEWGLDVVVAGSQKGFMLPPGLAFLTGSAKAWAAVERSDHARYFLDAQKERKALLKGSTAYTPAVSLWVGLAKALARMREEGLEALFARHAILARATREAMRALGLELFAGAAPSPALTSVAAPEGIDGQEIYNRLRNDYGVTIAGGQAELKGKIFRIAHLGWADRLDLIQAIAALEMVLADLGHPVELGKGVATAQAILREGARA